jgi:hypothetical protein
MLEFPYGPCLLVCDICHDPKIMVSDKVVGNLLSILTVIQCHVQMSVFPCLVSVRNQRGSELIAGSLHLDDSVSIRGSNKSGNIHT